MRRSAPKAVGRRAASAVKKRKNRVTRISQSILRHRTSFDAKHRDMAMKTHPAF